MEQVGQKDVKLTLTQTGEDLLSKFDRERQNLCHLEELAEGEGLGHLHPLGKSLQMSQLP